MNANFFIFWNLNDKQASVNLTDPNICDICLIVQKLNQCEQLVQQPNTKDQSERKQAVKQRQANQSDGCG